MPEIQGAFCFNFFSSMTGFTCFYGFAIPVTPETGNRIDSPVDAVTAQVVSPVRHSSAGMGLIF